MCGKKYINDGIYIDIFPLDYVKNKNSISFKIKFKIVKYISHILMFKFCRELYKEKRNTIKLILDYMVSIPAFIIPSKILQRISKSIMKSNGNEENAKYFVMYNGNKTGSILEKEVYLPERKIKFENKFYNVPGKIEEYLERNYGKDYMKLPPEEERHTHEPVELKF